MADALHHFSELRVWYSPFESDKNFGAKHNFFAQNLEGKNTYVHPTFHDGHLLEKIIDKIVGSLRTDKPTRVILLIPIATVHGKDTKDSRLIEIATFHSFPYVSPDSYRTKRPPSYCSEKVGLFLATNRASLKLDPIDWGNVVEEIMAWSIHNSAHVAICNTSKEKFQQRILPSYSPRAFSCKDRATFNLSSNFYHFYDFEFEPKNEITTMAKFVPDVTHLNLLSKANQHDRFAGCLGILPNQIIQFIQITNPLNKDRILEDIRFTTFFATYAIWKKRQELCHTFRNDAIPEAWRLERKRDQKVLGKHPRKSKKLAFENCKNPFHYLQTVDQKCPISQRTCDCSRRIALQNNKKHEKVRKRRKKHKNISSEDTTGLDYKYGPKTKTKQSTIDKLLKRSKQVLTFREKSKIEKNVLNYQPKF
jgi:hypothetical protein